MKMLLFSIVFVMAVFAGWSLSVKPVTTPEDVNLVQFPSDNPLTFLNAHRQRLGAIGIMWRISSSDKLVSFQVLHSYEGEFFDSVADVPCNSDTRFNWKEDDVFQDISTIG